MEEMIKVDALEVKRCFVVSQLTRKQKFDKKFLGNFSLKGRKKFLRDISLESFEEKLKVAKDEVSCMSEKELDFLIKKEYKKRLVAIDNSDWYVGYFSPSEAGVWRRAGDLPLKWTNESLLQTAEHVEKAIKLNHKFLTGRAKHVVPNVLKINVENIQKEKYLLPIILKGGTGTKGRRRLKRKMKYDIDDGCMRSIALTISGAEKIKAYIGFPKDK